MSSNPQATPSGPGSFINTARVQLALERARQGHAGASDELVKLADLSAQRAARRLLKQFPTVAAWYETGDVRQMALLRLEKAFEAVEIRDASHFHRLVAHNVRRTILGLKRHLTGPRGIAANEARFGLDDDSQNPIQEPGDETHDPERLAEWMEIHAAIDALPEQERQMFDLLWYSELSQEEAAGELGLSVRQVRRRWTAAKLRLWTVIPEAFQR